MKKKKILKNVEVEDRDIFIRISPEDSLETKKDVLEITESLIEAQIASEKFKQQRKEEMARRNEARKSSREALIAVNHILSELPKEIKIRVRHEKKAEVIQQPKLKAEAAKPVPKAEEIKPTKMSDLQKELENVKSKLSGMKF